MNAHRSPGEEDGAPSTGLPVWVRTLTVLVTLPTWAGIVILYLYRGELPPASVMAFPAGIIIACSGPDVVAGIARRKGNKESAEK